MSLVELAVAEASPRHHTLAVAVVRGGEPTFAGRSTAPGVDWRTALFEIGSITKPFTGVLLADAALRGKVDLRARASELLPPGAPQPQWRPAAATLLHLATHRTGLPNAPRGMNVRELAFVLNVSGSDPWAALEEKQYAELVRRTRARRLPRGAIRYSSLAFGLLGDVLAAGSGATYEESVRARITGPLGMPDTAVEPDREQLTGHSGKGRPRPPLDDRIEAAGGLRSTIEDMARFLAACCAPPDESPGPALDLAQRPFFRSSRRLSVGLGWMIMSRQGKPTVCFHNGGTWGFRSFAGFIRERNVGVVALSNTARSLDRLGLRLLDATV